MSKPSLKQLILYGLLVAVTSVGLLGTAFLENYLNRGVTWGADQHYIPHTDGNPLGANVFLDKEADRGNISRTFQMLHEGGFKYARQEFLWRDIEPQKDVYWDTKHNIDSWTKYDQIVELANKYGIELVARLDRPPDWARQNSMSPDHPDNTGPPDNFDDYGKFVYEVVKRYKGKVKYFQIWNEPNLGGEWNNKPIDPAEYTRLLKTAYVWAKVADPESVILTAGLAPTDQLGPENLNDLAFTEEMYKAGAKGYFDIMSVMVYGLGYPPDDRRTDFKRANFSRPALTHEIMVKYGDTEKPVWAAEYAWISLPPDWQGQPSVWGDSISPDLQAQYLVRGYQRAAEEWPWMGTMIIWGFRWVEPPEQTGADPTPYFAIVNHDWSPRPAYYALKTYAAELPAAHTGYLTAGSSDISYAGTWADKMQGGRISRVPQTPGSIVSFKFKGNRLDLDFGTVREASQFHVIIDGFPSPTLPKNAQGHAYFEVPAGDDAKVTVAKDLSDTQHTAQIVFDAGKGASLKGIVVSREQPFPWAFPAAYIICSLGLIGSLIRVQPWLIRAVQIVPQAVRRASQIVFYTAKPRLAAGAAEQQTSLLLAFMGAMLGVFYFVGDLKVTVAAAFLLFLAAAIRPDLSVGLVAFTIPFLYFPKQIGGQQFALAEVMIIISLLAYLTNVLVSWMFGPAGREAEPSPKPEQSIWTRIIKHPFALPAALFLLVATLSLLVPDAEHRRFAIREYRLVIVEPIIFVVLFVQTARVPNQVYRAIDFLVAGAVCVSAIAIGQTLLGTQLIEVEGVRRVLGVFRHPNNLALYLDRVILMLAGLVLFLPASFRRWMYAAASILPMIALVMTFSRGAWMAVALGILILALATKRRRIVVPAVAGAGLVAVTAVILVLQVERFSTVMDPASWTRLSVWRSAINMIRDHPITGVGLDQFLYQYNPKYILPDAWNERFTAHPHNILLDYWTRLGIMGVIAGGWLIINTLRHSYRLLSGASIQHVRALAAGVFGVMLAFLLHGIVDNSYFLMDLALMFWLGIGVILALRRLEKFNQAQQAERETLV